MEEEVFDMKLLEKILYDGQPYEENEDNNDIPSFHIKFTPDPVFATENQEKLEKLLLGQYLTTKKTQVSCDPLDLVHSKETQEISYTEKTLKNYLNDKRQYHKLNLPITSSHLLKDFTQCLSYPTCLKVTSNLVLIGNSYGLISVFTYFGQELKSIQSSKSFGAVTSVDISSDEQYIISGYAEGQIALWDFKTGNSLRVNNSYHTFSITAYKFWKGNSSTISADSSGKVMLVEYSKSFLSISISGSKIIDGEIGSISDIKVLESETKAHSLDSNRLVALAGYKSVIIYNLSPEISCVFTSKRPQDLPDSEIPSLAWKYSQFESNHNYTLSVSWGARISIYSVKFAIPEGIELQFSIEIDSSVISLVWMSDEVLLALSERKNFLVKPCEKKILAGTDRDYELVSHTPKNFPAKICRGVEGLDREVLLLASKEMHLFKLLTWNECIDEVSGQGEWLEVLSFGLDLYSGNYPSHYGFPSSQEELKNILEQLITIYVKVGTIAWVYKISNTIEFCVEIRALDILFNMLLDYFVDYGTEDNMEIFINDLEPYILFGKIKKIPTFALGKLMVFYLKKDKPEIIERVILNLDPESVDSEQVLPIVKEYKMMTAGIVVHSHKGEFLAPAKMIFEGFVEEKKIKEKRYILYKLLWYVRMCFRGERFLHGKIQDDVHEAVNLELLQWFLEDNHIELIIKQEMVCLLQGFWEVYSESTAQVIKSIIEKLVSFANTNYELSQVCCFIGKIVEKNVLLLEYSCAIKICEFLLGLNRDIENNPIDSSDISSYIHEITYGEQERIFFSDFSLKDIGKTVLKLLQSLEEIKKSDRDLLLKKSLTTPHILVNVYLLDLSENYNESFRILLSKDHEEKLFIFEWLNKRFSESDKPELKNYVINELRTLVEIDSDKTATLVKNWYQSNHKSIIKKLDNAPKLQLKYLSELLKDQFDKELVILNVRLMCDHSPEKLIEFLEYKEEHYEECLKICNEKKVLEAQAFLYEKLGSVKEALSLWIDAVQNTRLSLLAKMRKLEQIAGSEILRLGKMIKKYGKVCVRNTVALDSYELEEFWICIFKNTLDCYMDFKDYMHLYPQIDQMMKLSIDYILSNTLEHVDLTQIISLISKDYEDFTFKHMKHNVIDVLTKYSHLQSILSQANRLLKLDISYSTSQLYSSRLEGHASDFMICRTCSKPIGVTGNISIFACGHAYHKKCNEIPVCLLCNE